MALARRHGVRQRVDTARAALLARLASRNAREARRFRLLAGVAEAADGQYSVEETAQRLADLLVPDLADIVVFDVAHEGAMRRLRVTASGADRDVAEATLRACAPSRADLPGVGAAVAYGRAHLVAPMTDALLRAGARDDAELAALRAIGITSALIVPLLARGRALGALTLIVTRASGRTFAPEELGFVEVLAGRVALALDNAGLFVELRSVEAQLSVALGTLSEAVTVQNARGNLIYGNDTAARMLGYASPREMLADPTDAIVARFEFSHEDGSPVDPDEFPGRRLLTGKSADPLVLRVVDRDSGEVSWRVTKASAVRDGEGRVTMIVNVITDITPVKRFERSQRLLAAAGEALAAPRDYLETAERLARICAPELGDWAAVVDPDEHGLLRACAVAHGPHESPELARWMAEGLTVSADAPYGVAKAFREGRVELSPDITEEKLAAVAGDEDALRGLRALGMRAALAIPLVVGDRTIGVLSLMITRSGRRFTDEDIGLAVEIARRAASAIETARLYTERSAIAATLQQSLLPDALPELPGWELASLYRPAGEETWVGGDFYEVVQLGEDWLLVLGDVTGRGAEAAALTALTRHTLRTAARLTESVPAALDALNRELTGRHEPSLCTAVCVLLRETEGGGVAEIICAGHPPPALVRGGQARYVGAPGGMLGAFADERWTPEQVVLQDGDVLVLYSDGVLDAVGADERFGAERLEMALRGTSGARDAVARVEAALSGFTVGPQADDTAVLAAQRRR